MNAERLHAITKAIRRDLKQTNSLTLLQQLQAALQQHVAQPGAPQFQQQVSQFRKELGAALSKADSNAFSPAWRQVLDQVGASSLLGTNLRDEVERVFMENQITAATASEQLQELLKRLGNLSRAADQVVTGLSALSIGSEDLDPGECELGVLVPRDAVQSELPQLSEELGRLQRIFAPFSELATGARPAFSIRTISSTDFGIFLDVAPEVAACIAVAVERVVSLYKQLLEIRRLRQDLRDQGVSDKSLAGIDTHADRHMSQGIDKATEAILAQFGSANDAGRQNELRKEIRVALTQIANRIDRGFNIDVRAEPIAMDGSREPEDIRHYDAIAAAAKELRFMRLTGRPILSLGEPERSEGEGPTLAD